MPTDVFTTVFDFKSRNDKVVSKVAADLARLSKAAQSAGQQAIPPMVKSVNQMVAAFPKVSPRIMDISKALQRISEPAKVTGNLITALRADIMNVKKAGGPFSATARDIDKVLRKMSGTLLVLTSGTQVAEEGAKRFLSVLTKDAPPKIIALREEVARLEEELEAEQAIIKETGSLEEFAGVHKAASINVKDLKEKLKGVKGELKAVETPYKRAIAPIISTMEKLASGGRVTSGKITELMSRVRRLGKDFGYAAGWARPLVRRLSDMQRALVDTERAAKSQVSDALRPWSKTLQNVIAQFGTVPAPMQRIQKGMTDLQASFQAGSLSAKQVQRAINLVRVAGGELSAQQRAMIPKTLVSDLEKLFSVLKKNEAVQRELGRAMAFGFDRGEKEIKSLRRMQSVASGVMMGTSLLQGNIRSLAFSFVFLRFAQKKAVFQAAALTVAFGLLAKAVKLVISTLLSLIKGFLSIIVKAIKGAVSLITRLVKGICSLVVKLVKGAMSLAVKVLKGALGAAGGLLTSFLDLVNRIFSKVAEIIVRSVQRASTALQGLGKAILEATRKIPQIGEPYEKASASIRESIQKLLAVIGQPFVRDVILPLLEILARLANEVFSLARSFMTWVQKSGLWAAALQVWKDAIQDFMPTLREMWIGIKIILIGAIYLSIAAFKALGFIIGRVMKAVAGLWAWFKKWLKTMKPLWDSLRMMSQALKEMDWRAFLQGAKDFITNLPPQLYSALLAAIGLIALFFGAKLASAIATSLGGQAWGMAVNAIFIGLAAALLAGIIDFEKNPDFVTAWHKLLGAIAKALASGEYSDAFMMVGGALLAGIARGLTMFIMPKGAQGELSDRVTKGINEALGMVADKDVKGGVGKLGEVLEDVVSTEWLRVLIIGLAAALATAFGSPALGVAMAAGVGLMLRNVPEGKLKEELVSWTKDTFGPALAGALAALVVPPPKHVFRYPSEVEPDTSFLKRLATFAVELVKAIGKKIQAAFETPEGKATIKTVLEAFGAAIIGGLEFLTQFLEKHKSDIVGCITDTLNAITDAITSGPETPPRPSWMIPDIPPPVPPKKSDLSGVAGAFARFFTTVLEIVQASLIDSGALANLAGALINELVKFFDPKSGPGGKLVTALTELFVSSLRSAIDTLLEAEEGEENRLVKIGKAIGGGIIAGVEESLKGTPLSEAYDLEVTPEGERKARTFGGLLAAIVTNAFAPKELATSPAKLIKAYFRPQDVEVVKAEAEAESAGIRLRDKYFTPWYVPWAGAANLIKWIRLWLLPNKTADAESAAQAAGKRLLAGGSPGFLPGVEAGWTESLRPYLEETVVGGITDLLTVGLPSEEWGSDFTEHFKTGVQSKLENLLKEIKSIGKKIRDSLYDGIGEIVVHVKVVYHGSLPPSPPVNELQHGGIVTRPTLALIGERGPEAVVPLSGGRGRVGVAPVNVYVTGNYILDDMAAGRLADKVGQAVVKKINRHYQIGFVGVG